MTRGGQSLAPQTGENPLYTDHNKRQGTWICKIEITRIRGLDFVCPFLRLSLWMFPGESMFKHVQTEQVHRRACLYVKCMCIYIYRNLYSHTTHSFPALWKRNVVFKTFLGRGCSPKCVLCFTIPLCYMDTGYLHWLNFEKGQLIFLNFHYYVHPPKLAWNLTIPPWKRRNISQPPIFGFHLIFRRCTGVYPPFFSHEVLHNFNLIKMCTSCQQQIWLRAVMVWIQLLGALHWREEMVRLLERNWIL